MTALLSKLKNLLRWARITKGGDDSGDYPIQQLEYMGKTAEGSALFPYGLHANMPADVLVLIGSVYADEPNRVVIGCIPPGRPTLSPGEVALYHPGTGSIVKMKASGDIELKGTNVTIDATQTTITGDVDIDGNLTVGPLDTDFLTHTHVGSPTAPLGAISPTGIVVP